MLVELARERRERDRFRVEAKGGRRREKRRRRLLSRRFDVSEDGSCWDTKMKRGRRVEIADGCTGKEREECDTSRTAAETKEEKGGTSSA